MKLESYDESKIDESDIIKTFEFSKGGYSVRVALDACGDIAVSAWDEDKRLVRGDIAKEEFPYGFKSAIRKEGGTA